MEILTLLILLTYLIKNRTNLASLPKKWLVNHSSRKIIVAIVRAVESRW
jgi:hypothetical protein